MDRIPPSSTSHLHQFNPSSFPIQDPFPALPPSTPQSSFTASSSRTPSRHSSSGHLARAFSDHDISTNPPLRHDPEYALLACPSSYCALPTSTPHKNTPRLASWNDNMTMHWISTMVSRHALLDSLRPKHSRSAPSEDGPFHRPRPEPDPATKILTAPLVPPLGFAMVAPGVYRSGHPNHCNFAFLEGLQLNSIMYLSMDSYRPHTFNWAQDRGLKIFHYRIDSFKHPNVPPPDHAIYASALSHVLDRRNLPILVHCNKGQHRVGTLCALLRRVQGWDKPAAKAEWDKFLGESAAPGRNMIWSPGLLMHPLGEPIGFLAGPEEPRVPPPGKAKKIKNKLADGLARANEWEYVNEFPIELIRIDPEWTPSWLPPEAVSPEDVAQASE